MELFMLRHGHAESEAERDSLRPLSAQGRIEAQGSVSAHRDSMLKVERLLVSPYLRARQTADIVLQDLASIHAQLGTPAPSIEICDYLVPNANPDHVIEALYSAFHSHDSTSLCIVSHQPLVGILLDNLCGLEPGRHRMGTASLAALDVDVLASGCCQLRWLHHAN